MTLRITDLLPDMCRPRSQIAASTPTATFGNGQSTRVCLNQFGNVSPAG